MDLFFLFLIKIQTKHRKYRVFQKVLDGTFLSRNSSNRIEFCTAFCLAHFRTFGVVFVYNIEGARRSFFGRRIIALATADLELSGI